MLKHHLYRMYTIYLIKNVRVYCPQGAFTCDLIIYIYNLLVHIQVKHVYMMSLYFYIFEDPWNKT